MNKLKIKPCPFCGSNPDLYFKMCISGDYYSRSFFVECSECDFVKSGSYTESEDAINSWNLREGC